MATKVLGYGRVSTIDQKISPEVQEKHCRDWYQSQAERGEWPDGSQFLGMLVDKAISGKVDLFHRPQGQHILARLSRGDVLVVSKLSRAFRSTRDALCSLETSQDLGIRLVLIDMAIDTSTATGKLMLTVLAGVAEIEREMIAERTRDAIRYRMDEGQWMGIAPPGWTLRTKSQTRQRNNSLVPDPDGRRLCLFAARQIHRNVPLAMIAAQVNAMSDKASGGRSIKRRQKEYSAKLMLAWATYYVCDYPPFTRAKILEVFGDDAFTVEFIRSRYVEPGSLAGRATSASMNLHTQMTVDC